MNMRLLETALQLTAYGITIVVGGIVCERMYVQHASRVEARAVNEKQAALMVGKTLKVKGYDWEQSDKTLVFSMSTSCHFCAASGPFYKVLTGRLTSIPKSKLRTLAVLPEDLERSRAFAAGVLEVNFDGMVQDRISLSTPTLLVISRRGVVEASWIGEVPADAQQDVVAKVLKLAGLSGS